MLLRPTTAPRLTTAARTPIAIRHLSTTSTFRSTPPQDQQQPAKQTQTPPPPPPRPSNPQYAPLSIWPFVGIFAAGTFLFSQIVKQREGTAPPAQSSSRSSFN